LFSADGQSNLSSLFVVEKVLPQSFSVWYGEFDRQFIGAFGKLPLLFQGWDDHKLTLWKSAGSKHLSSIVLLDKNIQGMNIESLPVWFVKSHTFHIPLQK